MKQSPLIIRHIEGLDVELLGSVHMLVRNVPRILQEIERFDPGFVALELTNAGRVTGSMDVDMVNAQFHDRVIAIDRSPEATSSRYLCGTPPARYFRESVNKFAWLPFNEISILAYNYLNRLYRRLLNGNFYTFGWWDDDARRFIFERDEYMAGRLAEHMRSRRAEEYRNRYAAVVGRRHVAGMAAILQAYAVTGDIGSYYAGGKVYDVFNLAELERPYDVPRAEAESNLQANRIIESLTRSVFLPIYMVAVFLASAFVIGLIVTIIVRVLLGLW